MIPLGDSVAGRQRPVVTLGLLAACVLVFAYELILQRFGQPSGALDAFVQRWGAVPRLVLAALAGDPRVPRQDLVTLLTSQFIHAGFWHLGGNLVFLWVFGRAVEDRVGPGVFLVVYLIAGALAGLAQCLLSASDSVPLIGASGAIAAVLGIYFVAYPTAWVRVLMPVLFFFWTFDLPALLVLAFWFATQFLTGMAAITQASQVTGNSAVWAHIAGFVLGAASAPFLPRRASRPSAGTSAPPLRRGDAPGPARLVSSLADLAAVLLAARLAIGFFGWNAARSPLAGLATPILDVTNPVVAPFQAVLPSLRVLGGVLETCSLAAIALVYVVAGLIGQAFVRKV